MIDFLEIVFCVLLVIMAVALLVLCRLCDIYIYLRKKELEDEKNGKKSE